MALIRHLHDLQDYNNAVYDHEDGLQSVRDNLTRMLEAKDEEIRRINSHCEYLMQLYYDSEEMLAKRGTELLKLRAKLETCSCIEVRTVTGVNEDIISHNSEQPLRQSLDSKIQRRNAGDRSTDNNRATCQSMSLPCSSSISLDIEDRYTNNDSTQPQSPDLRSFQSTALSHQSKYEGEMSIRQSLCTGWSDFSQFIDDSPLLTISSDYSSLKQPFGMIMSDEVSSSKADILVIDHNNISSGSSDTTSTDDNTVKNVASDDDDEEESQLSQESPIIEDEHVDEDVYEANMVNSKNDPPRQDMSAESGYDTAMDGKMGNLETSLSEDSGLDDPYVSSKRLKPKALSYTFDILPSKTSIRMPATSKTNRKSINMQASKVNISNVKESKMKPRKNDSSNIIHGKTTRSLIPLQVKNMNSFKTKSLNLYMDKKTDVPLKHPSPPPLERKSTYTKEDIEAQLNELEKSESLSLKNDTYTKEDFDRTVDQQILDLKNNELSNEDINHLDKKKDTDSDDVRSRAIIDEIFNGSGRNSRAKENHHSRHAIKSARIAKTTSQYLMEPPRPKTANTNSIGKNTNHETLHSIHDISSDISNINIDIQTNLVECKSADQLSPSPEALLSRNKRLLNIRPSQPKPIGHSLDTKLYTEPQRVQNATKSVDFHGSLQLDGIMSPRAYIAHIKRAKNQTLAVDNQHVITLKQTDDLVDVHGSTMFVPHAPTSRRCSTPNSYRKQNYEHCNEMARTWTQLFS